MQKECDTSIEKVGCSTTGYQDVDVCIPVTIRPFGEVGNVKTRCEGSPSIIRAAITAPANPARYANSPSASGCGWKFPWFSAPKRRSVKPPWNADVQKAPASVSLPLILRPDMKKTT